MSPLAAPAVSSPLYGGPQPVLPGHAPNHRASELPKELKQHEIISPGKNEHEIVAMGDFDTASLRRAANCWGRAMIDDPTLTWLTDGKCPQRLVTFFDRCALMFLRGTADRSCCWALQPTSSSPSADGGGSARPDPLVVCVASEYPRTYPGTLALLRGGLLHVLLAVPSLSTIRVFGRLMHTFDTAKEEFYRENGPFLYITCFGTDPDHQGKGLGSKLMRVVLAHADSRRIPAYLEANSDDSRRFYERHGFKVLRELSAAPGAPSVYLMARMAAEEPRAG
ncbi:hypothetical protein Agub_g15305 [Astrephomene gubernaculifera]|uniref:N-acetyltransferase domain-containing protein n=1 Tax=Astrephomene gubernaculifera TaxID=47775 RepID=A0AAD3E303_9CHLO|nr:hypothetical protein Agub_g15305 [Astrephomene gubernaculifera]